MPSHLARAVPLALSLLLPIAFGLVSLALGMDANWDLRNYHYYNGYAFLTGRRDFDLVPAQLPSFFNPLIDVPFFVAAEALPARLVGFVLGALHGLNFILLFLIAEALLVTEHPRWRVGVACAAALAGLTGAGGLSEVGTVFYDNTVASLGMLAAAAIVMRNFDRLLSGPNGDALPLAALAGLPIGLAVGLKLPAGVFAVGLCAGFLAGLDRPLRRLALAWCFGLGVLIGFGASGGHWLWLMWRDYGNPFFPFFNDLFRSPMALPLPYRDDQYVPHGLGDRLGLAFAMTQQPRLVGETLFRDLRLPLAYALVPLAALAAALRWALGAPAPGRMVRGRLAAYLFAAAALSYALWLVMFSIYRYLIPLEMLAPTLIIAAIALLPLWASLRALLGAAALVAVVATTLPGDWIRVPWQARYLQVSLPRIPRPEQTMVLMAGHEPLSFLIPAFPQKMRFVRIDSSFTHPGEDSGLTRLMRRTVAEHRGELAALYMPTEEQAVMAKLDQYGLRLDRAGCEPVGSTIGAAVYAYCPVRRG